MFDSAGVFLSLPRHGNYMRGGYVVFSRGEAIIIHEGNDGIFLGIRYGCKLEWDRFL